MCLFLTEFQFSKMLTSFMSIYYFVSIENAKRTKRWWCKKHIKDFCNIITKQDILSIHSADNIAINNYSWTMHEIIYINMSCERLIKFCVYLP